MTDNEEANSGKKCEKRLKKLFFWVERGQILILNFLLKNVENSENLKNQKKLFCEIFEKFWVEPLVDYSNPDFFSALPSPLKKIEFFQKFGEKNCFFGVGFHGALSQIFEYSPRGCPPPGSPFPPSPPPCSPPFSLCPLSQGWVCLSNLLPCPSLTFLLPSSLPFSLSDFSISFPGKISKIVFGNDDENEKCAFIVKNKLFLCNWSLEKNEKVAEKIDKNISIFEVVSLGPEARILNLSFFKHFLLIFCENKFLGFNLEEKRLLFPGKNEEKEELGFGAFEEENEKNEEVEEKEDERKFIFEKLEKNTFFEVSSSKKKSVSCLFFHKDSENLFFCRDDGFLEICFEGGHFELKFFEKFDFLPSCLEIKKIENLVFFGKKSDKKERFVVAVGGTSLEMIPEIKLIFLEKKSKNFTLIDQKYEKIDFSVQFPETAENTFYPHSLRILEFSGKNEEKIENYYFLGVGSRDGSFFLLQFFNIFQVFLEEKEEHEFLKPIFFEQFLKPVEFFEEEKNEKNEKNEKQMEAGEKVLIEFFVNSNIFKRYRIIKKKSEKTVENLEKFYTPETRSLKNEDEEDEKNGKNIKNEINIRNDKNDKNEKETMQDEEEEEGKTERIEKMYFDELFLESLTLRVGKEIQGGIVKSDSVSNNKNIFFVAENRGEDSLFFGEILETSKENQNFSRHSLSLPFPCTLCVPVLSSSCPRKKKETLIFLGKLRNVEVDTNEEENVVGVERPYFSGIFVSELDFSKVGTLRSGDALQVLQVLPFSNYKERPTCLDSFPPLPFFSRKNEIWGEKSRVFQGENLNFQVLENLKQKILSSPECPPFLVGVGVDVLSPSSPQGRLLIFQFFSGKLKPIIRAELGGPVFLVKFISKEKVLVSLRDPKNSLIILEIFENESPENPDFFYRIRTVAVEWLNYPPSDVFVFPSFLPIFEIKNYFLEILEKNDLVREDTQGEISKIFDFFEHVFSDISSIFRENSSLFDLLVSSKEGVSLYTLDTKSWTLTLQGGSDAPLEKKTAFLGLNSEKVMKKKFFVHFLDGESFEKKKLFLMNYTKNLEVHFQEKANKKDFLKNNPLIFLAKKNGIYFLEFEKRKTFSEPSSFLLKIQKINSKRRNNFSCWAPLSSEKIKKKGRTRILSEKMEKNEDENEILIGWEDGGFSLLQFSRS